MHALADENLWSNSRSEFLAFPELALWVRNRQTIMICLSLNGDLREDGELKSLMIESADSHRGD